jgi:salicylate hydroxylase
MLPFGAQGANQAIEDAGALGALFTSDTTASNVPARLELFESVRRLRASRVQTMSRVRLGKEKEVEGQVRLYTEPGCTGQCSYFLFRLVDTHAITHDYQMKLRDVRLTVCRST